jgi:hypothetical protein
VAESTSKRRFSTPVLTCNHRRRGPVSGSRTFANIHHDEEYGLQFRLRSSLPEDLVEAANRKTILECGLPVSSGSGYSRKNRENHLREILRNCRRTIDKHVLCYIPFAE